MGTAMTPYGRTAEAPKPPAATPVRLPGRATGSCRCRPAYSLARPSPASWPLGCSARHHHVRHYVRSGWRCASLIAPPKPISRKLPDDHCSRENVMQCAPTLVEERDHEHQRPGGVDRHIEKNGLDERLKVARPFARPAPDLDAGEPHSRRGRAWPANRERVVERGDQPEDQQERGKQP